MSGQKNVRVCTRGSLLARTQTQWVIDRLAEANPGVAFEMIIVKTRGDILSEQNKSAAAVLDKGVFTKEIEEALLNGSADIAVHSLKDLPTELPEGLVLGAVPKRADPRDAVIGPGDIIEKLKANAAEVKIGTSSIRRKAQLRAAFPGCVTVDIRGNVDTRLRKVGEGVVDAIVIAAAGLGRIGRENEITELLDSAIMLSAPAQGALAIETRADDPAVSAIVSRIDCKETSACAAAERSFLHGLGSGCRAPVGALATVESNMIHLRGRVISEDGAEMFEGGVEGPVEDAQTLGQQLAEKLLADGAGKILEACMEQS